MSGVKLTQCPGILSKAESELNRPGDVGGLVHSVLEPGFLEDQVTSVS